MISVFIDSFLGYVHLKTYNYESSLKPDTIKGLGFIRFHVRTADLEIIAIDKLGYSNLKAFLKSHSHQETMIIHQEFKKEGKITLQTMVY